MTLPPVIRTVEVPCPQRRAFEIFVGRMDRWWPLARFSVSALRGQQAAGLRVEPRVAGRLVELGPAGEEHHWGTFTAYDPYDSFSMDFHIAEPAHAASQVEVTFVPVLRGRATRVTLTQVNWEAFGRRAKDMYGGYAKGWAVILDEAYVAACAA